MVKYGLLIESDIEQILPMSEKGFGKMEFDKLGYTFNKETYRERFSSTLDKKTGCTIIAKEGGKVVGYFSIFLTPSTTNFDDIVAMEGHWNTSYDLPKPKRKEIMEKLVVLGMNYAKNKKAKALIISTNVDFPGAGKILVKLGFKPQEIAHFYKF